MGDEVSVYLWFKVTSPCRCIGGGEVGRACTGRCALEEVKGTAVVPLKSLAEFEVSVEVKGLMFWSTPV